MAMNSAGAFDRPWGTGTSARLALLHATGELDVREPYVNPSVLATTYTPDRQYDDDRRLRRRRPGDHGQRVDDRKIDLWVDRRDALANGFML